MNTFTQSKTETLISVVLIADDDIKITGLYDYLNELHKYLSCRYTDYEIIIVDPNHKMASGEIKKDILKKLPSIRWISMVVSSLKMEQSMEIGVKNAIGDYVVLIRPVIDPINIIENMVRECSQGYDVIIGVADSPKTFSYGIMRKIGYRMARFIDYQMPENVTPVRCLSRRAINTIMHTGKSYHHSFAIKTGYNMKNHDYCLRDPGKIKKKTLVAGMKHFLRLLISNSVTPLRWINSFGFLGSLSAFSFSLYSVMIHFVKDTVVEGWTTIVFFFSIFFMILFIILTFLSEYIIQLLDESRTRDAIHVSNEERSASMIEVNRLNVVESIKESF